VPPRVDVDVDLPPVSIPADLLHELCSHALETRPEECCGLLIGNAEERYRHLFRCRNVMTVLHKEDAARYPRDGRTAFHMSEHDYVQAQKEAEVAGLNITAVYHSHVGAGAYLSEMDLEYAQQPLFPFPDADQIVIDLDDIVRDIAMFRRGANGFLGYPVEKIVR